MPDTTSLQAIELVPVIWSSVAAATMQLCSAVLLPLKVERIKMLASVVMTAMFCGGIAIILQYKGMHPYIAGVTATFVGALPAILIPMIITKKVLEKSGTNLEELSEMMSNMKEIADKAEAQAEAEVEKEPQKKKKIVRKLTNSDSSSEVKDV